MSIHSLYTNRGIGSSSSFARLEGLLDFVCREGMGSLPSHCFLGLVDSSGVSKSRIAALRLRPRGQQPLRNVYDISIYGSIVDVFLNSH